MVTRRRYGYQDESLRRAVAVANDEGDSDADDEFEFQLERDRRRRLAAGRGDWQRSGAGRGGTEGTDDATNEDGARNDAYWDNEAPGVALTAPIHLHSWKVRELAASAENYVVCLFLPRLAYQLEACDLPHVMICRTGEPLCQQPTTQKFIDFAFLIYLATFWNALHPGWHSEAAEEAR